MASFGRGLFQFPGLENDRWRVAGARPCSRTILPGISGNDEPAMAISCRIEEYINAGAGRLCNCLPAAAIISVREEPLEFESAPAAPPRNNRCVLDCPTTESECRPAH